MPSEIERGRSEAAHTNLSATDVRLAENRLTELERSDVRRSVYDRFVNAVITTIISALITMHGRWWK